MIEFDFVQFRQFVTIYIYRRYNAETAEVYFDKLQTFTSIYRGEMILPINKFRFIELDLVSFDSTPMLCIMKEIYKYKFDNNNHI